MLGDGNTQGESVSSSQNSLLQPSISITVRAHPTLKNSLNIWASSPIVIPCRVGIGNWPTNEANCDSSPLPSTCLPLIGLGRSQTITFFPALAAALMQFAMV